MYIKYTMNGVVQGRAISIGDLKTALDKSYSKTKVKTGFGDFEVDADLTTKETQTYVNPKSGQVLVVHRGTQGLRDIFADIAYTASGYKGKRFKDANQIQKKAENKYGAHNVSTLATSLVISLGMFCTTNCPAFFATFPAFFAVFLAWRRNFFGLNRNPFPNWILLTNLRLSDSGKSNMTSCFPLDCPESCL